MMRVALLAVLLVAVCASSAQATTIGVENDNWMVDQSPSGITAELARADQIHAGWLELKISDGRWATESNNYLLAAQSARRHGLKVLVTLMSWNTHPAPEQWASFARRVVGVLGPYANAWSPMNEPNQRNMSPAQNPVCQITQAGDNSWSYQIRTKTKPRRRWRWKRTKRGHGQYIRKRYRRWGHWTYKRVHGRLIRKWHRPKHKWWGHWTYKRVHGKARKRARWIHERRHPRTIVQDVHGTTKGKAIKTCQAEGLGLSYRRVWDAVAPIIRASSSAPLCVGDQMPTASNKQFMDAFYKPGTPAIAPDLLCVHPYDWSNPQNPQDSPVWNVSNIGKAAAYARSHGLRLWISEWAYMPDQPAGWWPLALTRMEDAGAEVIIIFDTPSSPGHSWNTFMTPEALSTVAGWQQ